MSTDTPKPPALMVSGAGAGSNLAKVSCIAGLFGILSLVAASTLLALLFGLVAIICGHVARMRIRKSRKNPLASGMAMTGIIVGYIYICMPLLDHHFFERSINRAKSVTTLATATALEAAVNGFFIEYNKLPDVGNRVTTNSSQGVELLNILLGLEPASSNPQNNRQIKFLSVREGKNGKNGLIYSQSGDTVEGLFDSWGNPFTVILDTDNDEILRFTVSTKEIELKGRRVAVFSPGADQKEGTGDDIRTW